MKSSHNNLEKNSAANGVDEPHVVTTLTNILSGRHDNDDIAKNLEKAIDDLEGAGLEEKYGELIDRAIDYNTKLLKRKAGRIFGD